jgi:hypothetical protein
MGDRDQGKRDLSSWFRAKRMKWGWLERERIFGPLSSRLGEKWLAGIAKMPRPFFLHTADWLLLAGFSRIPSPIRDKALIFFILKR